MTDTKTNTKKAEPSKVWTVKKHTIKTALLEFQKLAVTAKKDGKNPHFRSNYSTLESVIEAVKQGNQFGLFFTQGMTYEYVSDINGGNTVIPVVFTKVMHEHDDTVIESKLPIMLAQTNMENPQKIGSAITYYKRYTLQSVYGLPSEDDDGNVASQPTITTSKPKTRGEDDGL
jgi:hypothetical protein|tara:strand:+ start:17 stop:535 length:519 start_codon:yes stop_codon:yes gene_type:complete